MLLGKLNNLTYRIDDITILKDIHATIPKGASIALVGANGAGKSTLLALISKRNTSHHWVN